MIFEYILLFQVRFIGLSDFEHKSIGSVTPKHVGYTPYVFIKNEE